MQGRDPKPARPIAAESGPAGRESGARNGVVPMGLGYGYRSGAAPGMARPHMNDPRMPMPAPRGAAGRVMARPGPRPPIFTHSEPATATPSTRYPGLPAARSGFGLPSLRRNVCPHFYMTGSRGAIPIQAPHLLKALIRQEQNVSRCQLRGGVHLEQGYVNDVCSDAALQSVRLLRRRPLQGLTGLRLDYPSALQALQSRGRFGIHLGLSRTNALLEALDHPERSFRGALIAGTNGKGSVLALVTATLAAAGYRVGHTPKPHLVTYRERLQIGGVPIDADAFARLASRVLPLADRVARRHGDPTEFELLTAMTFLWFAESSIDLAVVEVGLGGRLDATHAWDGGVAVITNVTLDHMDRLGSTVEAIAHEKAAIVMRGDLAVTGAWGTALDVVERRCRSVAAPLTVTPPAPLLGLDRDGIEVELGRLGRTRVGLRGSHQAANAAVADATLDALEAAGIASVPDDARRIGYAAVQWPGRMELIEVPGRPGRPGRPPESGPGRPPESDPGRPPESGRREVLLDGAHNPAGAAALARGLDEVAPFLGEGRPTLVLAIMADKDFSGVIAALSGSTYLRDARVICTAPSGGRALPAVVLAARWQELAGRAAEAVDDPAAAINAALASGNGPGRRRGLPLSRGSGPRDTRGRSSAGARSADAASRARSVTAFAGRASVPVHPQPTRIGNRVFAWGTRTFVMGIVNVTPDSFSGDGLLASDPAAAVAIQQTTESADAELDSAVAAALAASAAPGFELTYAGRGEGAPDGFGRRGHPRRGRRIRPARATRPWPRTRRSPASCRSSPRSMPRCRTCRSASTLPRRQWPPRRSMRARRFSTTSGAFRTTIRWPAWPRPGACR